MGVSSNSAASVSHYLILLYGIKCIAALTPEGEILFMPPSSTESGITEILDASGLQCPLPLLKAKQALNHMSPGEVLKVIATDSGSVRDFRVYAENSDHELLDSFTEGECFIHIIKCGTSGPRGSKARHA